MNTLLSLCRADCHVYASTTDCFVLDKLGLIPEEDSFLSLSAVFNEEPVALSLGVEPREIPPIGIGWLASC